MDGKVVQIGHYVVAKPVSDREWMVYDYPSKEPFRANAAALWKHLGIGDEKPAIVLSANGSFVESHHVVDVNPYSSDMGIPAKNGRTGQVHEIGMVQAPVDGERVVVDVDLTGAWVGDSVELAMAVQNPSRRLLTVSAGEASCSCAKLRVVNSSIGIGETVSCSGVVQLAASMSRRPEWADLVLRFKDDGALAGTIRVEIRGKLLSRASVEPPVVSFGRVKHPMQATPLRVQVRHTTLGQYVVRDEVPSPFTVKVVDRSDAGEITFEIGLHGESVEPGGYRSVLRLVDPANPSATTEVPLEVTIVSPVSAVPSAVVITGNTSRASVRFASDDQEAASVVGIHGLVGVEAFIHDSGYVEFCRRADIEPPRLQNARVQLRHGKTSHMSESRLVVISR